MTIKRLNYFDNQFLVEADFTDQQQYHLDTHRRLARLVSTPGIGEGLEVVKSGPKAVTIRPGAAVDRDGRTMIVEANQLVPLTDAKFAAGRTVFITLTYQEQQSDPSTATGAPGMTRVTEQPIPLADIVAPPTDGPVIRLATFVLDNLGQVPGADGAILDGGVRVLIGPKGERGLASIDGVTSPGGNVDFVAGSGISITSNQTNRNITFGGLGVASVDGVSSPAGNIDLVAAQAVTVTPDIPNKKITIGESHSTRTGNPHGLQAADIGALLASEYDLRRRAVVSASFQTGDADGAVRTVNVPFQTRLASVFGKCNVGIGTRITNGAFTAFADFVNASFIHTSVGIGRPFTGESFLDVRSGTFSVCDLSFFSLPDSQGELLQVRLSNVSATGFTVTLSRSRILANPLASLSLELTMLCMG